MDNKYTDETAYIEIEERDVLSGNLVETITIY